MQDKPKVQKASPKERKSERSENGNIREEEMKKKTQERKSEGSKNGKGKSKKAKTGRTGGLK